MSKRVLAFYIDMRDSTSIEVGEVKKEIYSDFYKKFKSLKKREGQYQISRFYPAGDGILLIANCRKINNEKLNNLLIDIQEKIDAFEYKNNIILGVGLAYGKAYDIQMSNNNQNTETITIGTPLDLAAKASDFANKGENPQWFIMNNNRTNQLEEQYNDELIGNLYECNNVEDDYETNTGNYVFNIY